MPVGGMPRPAALPIPGPPTAPGIPMPIGMPIPGTRGIPTSLNTRPDKQVSVLDAQTTTARERKQKNSTRLTRVIYLFGRRSLDGHRDEMLASEKDQAEDSLLLFLLLGSLGSDAAELFAVREDHVHVLVKRLEGAHELATVLESDADSVVDILQHLAALSLNRHSRFDILSIPI